jgi:hypothetical protein
MLIPSTSPPRAAAARGGRVVTPPSHGNGHPERITKIHTLEDTATLQAALDKLAAAGISEAHADPVTD